MKIRRYALASLSLAFLAISYIQVQSAGDSPGLLSFVFDDGNITDSEQALGIFQEFGYPASSAIIVDRIGLTGYMDVRQIRELRDSGWEIMSHTLSHPNLRRLSVANTEAELRDSRDALRALGFDVRNVVYPYNKSDSRVEEMASRYYRSARGGGNKFNDSTTPLSRLRSFEIKDDLARIERLIDEAAARGEWLILYHHRVMEKLRIGGRGGTFKTGEGLVFSPSGATGIFEPTLWNRIGNSLYLEPGTGSARPGDRVVGLESGAWAQVLGVGSDDRENFRSLLSYVRDNHGGMRVLTIDGGLDSLADERR